MTLIQKNPASLKILVIECTNGACTPYTNLLSSLGFTNVTTATSASSETDVASYHPDVVMALNTAWSVSKYTLFNQLYNDGYAIFTEGNDTTNAILPINGTVGTSAAAGTITPYATHPINQNWTSTANSGSDGRQCITATNANAVAIAKDISLDCIESIYLEETGKGRWFHYQPNAVINSVLLQNILSYITR